MGSLLLWGNYFRVIVTIGGRNYGGGVLLSGVVTEGGPGLLYWGSGLSEF